MDEEQLEWFWEGDVSQKLSWIGISFVVVSWLVFLLVFCLSPWHDDDVPIIAMHATIPSHLRYFMFQDSFEGKIHSILTEDIGTCKQFSLLFKIFWTNYHPWHGLCSRERGTNVNGIDRSLLLIFVVLSIGWLNLVYIISWNSYFEINYIGLINNEVSTLLIVSLISLSLYFSLYHCFSRSKPNRLSNQDIENLLAKHECNAKDVDLNGGSSVDSSKHGINDHELDYLTDISIVADHDAYTVGLHLDSYNYQDWKTKYYLPKYKELEQELSRIIGDVSNARNVPIDVSKWSVEHVCVWIVSLGLSSYDAEFEDAKIDGKRLLKMHKNDIKEIIHRSKDSDFFHEKLNELKKAWKLLYISLAKENLEAKTKANEIKNREKIRSDSPSLESQHNVELEEKNNSLNSNTTCKSTPTTTTTNTRTTSSKNGKRTSQILRIKDTFSQKLNAMRPHRGQLSLQGNELQMSNVIEEKEKAGHVDTPSMATHTTPNTGIIIDSGIDNDTETDNDQSWKLEQEEHKDTVQAQLETRMQPRIQPRIQPPIQPRQSGMLKRLGQNNSGHGGHGGHGGHRSTGTKLLGLFNIGQNLQELDDKHDMDRMNEYVARAEKAKAKIEEIKKMKKMNNKYKMKDAPNRPLPTKPPMSIPKPMQLSIEFDKSNKLVNNTYNKERKKKAIARSPPPVRKLPPMPLANYQKPLAAAQPLVAIPVAPQYNENNENNENNEKTKSAGLVMTYHVSNSTPLVAANIEMKNGNNNNNDNNDNNEYDRYGLQSGLHSGLHDQVSSVNEAVMSGIYHGNEMNVLDYPESLKHVSVTNDSSGSDDDSETDYELTQETKFTNQSSFVFVNHSNHGKKQIVSKHRGHKSSRPNTLDLPATIEETTIYQNKHDDDRRTRFESRGLSIEDSNFVQVDYYSLKKSDSNNIAPITADEGANGGNGDNMADNGDDNVVDNVNNVNSVNKGSARPKIEKNDSVSIYASGFNDTALQTAFSKHLSKHLSKRMSSHVAMSQANMNNELGLEILAIAPNRENMNNRNDKNKEESEAEFEEPQLLMLDNTVSISNNGNNGKNGKNGMLEEGTFVNLILRDANNMIVEGVIVAYNMMTQLADVKIVANKRHRRGNEIERFVPQTDIKSKGYKLNNLAVLRFDATNGTHNKLPDGFSLDYEGLKEGNRFDQETLDGWQNGKIPLPTPNQLFTGLKVRLKEVTPNGTVIVTILPSIASKFWMIDGYNLKIASENIMSIELFESLKSRFLSKSKFNENWKDSIRGSGLRIAVEAPIANDNQVNVTTPRTPPSTQESGYSPTGAAVSTVSGLSSQMNLLKVISDMTEVSVSDDATSNDTRSHKQANMELKNSLLASSMISETFDIDEEIVKQGSFAIDETILRADLVQRQKILQVHYYFNKQTRPILRICLTILSIIFSAATALQLSYLHSIAHLNDSAFVEQWPMASMFGTSSNWIELYWLLLTFIEIVIVMIIGYSFYAAIVVVSLTFRMKIYKQHHFDCAFFGCGLLLALWQVCSPFRLCISNSWYNRRHAQKMVVTKQKMYQKNEFRKKQKMVETEHSGSQTPNADTPYHGYNHFHNNNNNGKNNLQKRDKLCCLERNECIMNPMFELIEFKDIFAPNYNNTLTYGFGNATQLVLSGSMTDLSKSHETGAQGSCLLKTNIFARVLLLIYFGVNRLFCCHWKCCVNFKYGFSTPPLFWDLVLFFDPDSSKEYCNYNTTSGLGRQMFVLDHDIAIHRYLAHYTN